MEGYRWTRRVAVGGGGLIALIILFVGVTRILNVEIAGIQPEAWALTAMMTAPLTLGAVLVATLGTAAVERVSRSHR